MIAAALLRYRLPAEILAVLALLGALIFGVVMAAEHQRQIGRDEKQAEWTTANLMAERAAAAQTKLWQDKLDLASKGGNEREQTIKALAASASGAASSVRDTSAAISRALSTYSADSLRAVAGAYGDVFTECQDRRRGLAEEAERLNSEKQTLIEAWPK